MSITHGTVRGLGARRSAAPFAGTQNACVRRGAWLLCLLASALLVSAGVVAAGASRFERTAQAQLVRDIVGNPFQPNSTKRRKWTPAVLRHAKALYQGENTVTELHNALVKMGEAELAEHFETHPHHPKGCWVVDYILGKE